VRQCRAAAARCAGRGHPGPRPAWPWAVRPTWPRDAPALCDWVERGFDPVALGLDFIFSEYIQFLANSKICVEIHGNYYKTPKIMKFVSKFQLELPLAWQGCVASGRDIFLGLDLLFSRWIIWKP
jgi:hypothetical protein